ncbi:hypothetical protein MKX03_006242 [Papaver bracteatum]|nr:hypothetical protein MKX03_006242 [Papaver bracteatum]
MATTVPHFAAFDVQALGILTLKDFQQKNGIGLWMSRVRIVRMWHETDFMKTNDVTIFDFLLLDDTNTDIRPFEASSASIPHHKFHFTELENLAADSTNTYLTDVVGVLISHTSLQQFKRNSGNVSFMRELTLESLSGMRIKVTLWGDSTSELTRNLEANELNPHPVVAVVASVYVKQYLGKASLSSNNATKIYFDLDIPEVLHIRETSSHLTPPREITILVRVGYNGVAKSTGNTTMSISQLLEAKCESGYNAIGISTEKGWYYLGCHNCTTKLVGNKGDHWCLSCKVQIDEAVPRYLLRLEVEDSSGTAFFVARDSEVQKNFQLPALDVVNKGEVHFLPLKTLR